MRQWRPHPLHCSEEAQLRHDQGFEPPCTSSRQSVLGHAQDFLTLANTQQPQPLEKNVSKKYILITSKTVMSHNFQMLI